MATQNNVTPDLIDPDVDDEGQLEVEHYPLPDSSELKDPNMRRVWDLAVKMIEEDEEEAETPGENKD